MTTPRSIFDKLLALVAGSTFLSANPDDRAMKSCLQEGKPIPDYLLPGRLIMKYLTSEERETLAGLTADMTNDRQKLVYFSFHH